MLDYQRVLFAYVLMVAMAVSFRAHLGAQLEPRLRENEPPGVDVFTSENRPWTHNQWISMPFSRPIKKPLAESRKADNYDHLIANLIWTTLPIWGYKPAPQLASCSEAQKLRGRLKRNRVEKLRMKSLEWIASETRRILGEVWENDYDGMIICVFLFSNLTTSYGNHDLFVVSLASRYGMKTWNLWNFDQMSASASAGNLSIFCHLWHRLF